MPPDRLPSGWLPPSLDGVGSLEVRILSWLRRRERAKLDAALRDPEAAQRDALGRVLDAARGTAFARRHGLSEGMGLPDYRAAVPVRPFSGFAEDLKATAAGAPGVLVRHPVRSLVRTSGTSGEPKRLPVTDPWAAEVAEAQSLWVLAMVCEQPDIARGAVLAAVGRAEEERSEGGFPCGSNTGRMADAQPWIVRSRYVIPPAVREIEDPEARIYASLRIALALDIRSWTTANPSTILAWCRAMSRWREELSADLRDKTLVRGPAAAISPAVRRSLWAWLWRLRKIPADFRPLAFWPRLASVNCWKGGYSPFFLERLPEAMGGVVPVREAGISASEGYFAIPLHSSWTGGVAWAAGHLLEFVPEEGGEVRSLWEVEEGREYRLILSTTAGLYRYDLDDIVRVVGFLGRAPLLVFVRKGRDVLSVTGEKVTATQASEAVRIALAGAPTAGWSVGVRMAEKPVYTIHFEGKAPEDLASRFDRALRGLNEEYDSRRKTDRLADPEVERVPDGTYAAWRLAKLRAGVADGQIKDPVLLRPGDKLL